MKTRLLIIIGMLFVGFSGITFAEQPTHCTFGDKSIPLENIFEKDLAVKAFTEKHQNATRIAANESGSMKNQLVIQAQNDNIKETLEIKFNTDTKGCYIPASYHYSYDDGIIDVTIRNSVANFTEIMDLIKSNNKSIDDFYPDDCDFVDLDVTLTSGKVFGACKGTTSKFITLLIDAPSNGILEVDIPIQMVYSLPSTDCKPTGDFLVMSDNEETRYEIMPTDIGNLVKVEFAEGFHKIQIMGTVILPDPSPAQYCGIVEGYLDKKYLAPLDQTDNGVAFEFIRCNEDLVLIQKYDDTPACAKPESIPKLIERGWIDSVEYYNKQCKDSPWNCSQQIPESDDTLSESDYDPHSPRCGSGVVPYIPENWQTTGMHPSGETWETLNRHLMAQFFFKELQNRNIVFEPACFGVYTGFADAIDPPSYSMCSVVTASNGTTLYLEGTIREFDVTYFDIDNKIPYQCDADHHGCLCGIENEN